MAPSMRSYPLLLSVLTAICAVCAGQSRLYARLDDVEKLITEVRDQLHVENNLRTTQTVHFQMALEKVQKQLEDVSTKISSSGGGGGGGGGGSVEFNSRLRSLESAFNSLQGDVGGKVDTSIAKLTEVETRTARMKDDMDSKLKKVMNGINTIYDMNKEMRNTMAGSRTTAEPASPRRDGSQYGGTSDTSLSFLVDTIDDTQRKMHEQLDVLKNHMGRKLEGLEVLTNSLIEQNDALLNELEALKGQCPGTGSNARTLDVSPPPPRAPRNGTASSEVANRMLLEIKVSQLEMKSDFSKMMKDVENSLSDFKQCRGFDRTPGNRFEARSPKGIDNSEDSLAASESITTPRRAPAPSVQSVGEKCVTASHMMSPRNCADLRTGGATCDGVYIVYTQGVRAVRVYCDMTTDGGGWTVLMRRGNYTQWPLTFETDWNSYKHGFGDVEREFWLGNDLMHMLSTEHDMMLRVTLESFEGERIDLDYDAFVVGSENDHYRLRVGSYVGPHSRVGNSLRRHTDQLFSTAERDAARRRNNCAHTHKAGWWFHSCYSVLLTGEYAQERSAPTTKGIRWPSWKTVPLKAVEMKIRPKNFRLP
ncbi:hypothetical protein V5799_023811 [Amblyomma americanum]|uniref:Fibrinogen C-terminal domain-containing protein n=1 Tax=Amblyomma americanum TaxID=6943 RepID=A0AAQ4FHI4_AMBAM